MNLKEARNARHEAFTAFERAAKVLREAEADLEEAKLRAGEQAAVDRLLSKLSRPEKKRYHENVALADRLLAMWSDDEIREWYECMRKVLHYSEEEARIAGLHEERLHPYLCAWCTGWHKGGGEYREMPNMGRVRHKLIESIHREFPYREVKK